MGGFSCRIFNAGNTHVQIAELAGDSLRLIETVPTAEFRVEDFAVETMAAASVVPDLEEGFRKAGAFIVRTNNVSVRNRKGRKITASFCK